MEKAKEEAEKYSEYVREKLGDILSSAVADVAEARPEDPIGFLAQKLHAASRQRNTATSATAAGFRPIASFAALKPRQSYGVRVTKSRLSRCRVENEMSQIRVQSVRKIEKMAGNTNNSNETRVSEQATSIFRKLGLQESGQLPSSTNEPQGYMSESLVRADQHKLQTSVSQTQWENISDVDDEGFEDATTTFGRTIKPVFVHHKFKYNLADLHCDLFDDSDLS